MKLTKGLDLAQPKLLKEDSFALVNLEDRKIEGEAFDLKGVHHLAIATSDVQGCRFSDLNGSLDLGVGLSPSTVRRCIFANCKLAKLNFGYAMIEECEFQNCDIREFWSFDTDFKNCVFSGALRSGAFSVAPEFQRFQHGARIFSGNDFSNCEIPMDIFRGGINLSDQHFSTADGPTIVLQARAFLAAIERHTATTKTKSEALQRMIFTVRHSVTTYHQEQVFLPANKIRDLASDAPLVLSTIAEVAQRTH